MTRAIFIYGLIAGVLAVFGIIGTILLPAGNPLHESLWVGYLIMLVALSAILVGVKQYRDEVQGGVIGFGKAFLIGLGIAAVAGLAYALVWEAYLALTHYGFTQPYINETLATKR